MTVAVTGPTGHLGGNLVRALLATGHDVRAITAEPIDVIPAALRSLDVERVHADICDAPAIAAAIAGADVVYHLAAKISLVDWEADAVWEVNVEGTRNVVAACIASDVRRLVHVSSMASFAPSRRAVTEDEPASDDPSLPPYERSKAAGERIVLDGVDRGLDAVIVNPTGICGPGDHGPSPFGRTLLDLWTGRMPALVRGGFNIVDVRDLAAAMISAGQHGRTGQRYLVGGFWLSMMEVAELSAELFGTPVPRFVTPMWMARTAASLSVRWSKATRRPARLTPHSLLELSQRRLVLDTRAVDELGHRPRPIEETLRDTYDCFALRGLVPSRQPSTVS